MLNSLTPYLLCAQKMLGNMPLKGLGQGGLLFPQAGKAHLQQVLFVRLGV